MGNAQPQLKKSESDQYNSNMKVINSAQMMQNQNMDYSNLAAFDINSKMRSTLKYLEKNNFVSLKFEDLNAFYIQMTWKKYIANKSRIEKLGMIEVVYTSMENKANLTSKQERLFTLLDNKFVPHRIYDLVLYTGLKNVVNEFGGYDNLPAIFINNIYIGSVENLQEYEDLGFLSNIVKKEYERRCLVCNIVRPSKDNEVCLHCYRPYQFFSKAEQRINIFKNRLASSSDLIYED